MCKFNPKNDSRRIDPCMKPLMKWLKKEGYKTFGCCCGHGKYPMTIIMKDKLGLFFDTVSSKVIPRKKKFYKKDKQGVYYIPEVSEPKGI